MRQFLNNILLFLNAPTLTDDEFASVTALSAAYTQDTYNDLSRILKDRESMSDIQDRLIGVYKAKGVNVTPIDVAQSNVFIGAVL